MSVELDIVIPVYNEGANIIRVLGSLRRSVKTPFRALICYDDDADDTLTALCGYQSDGYEITFVKNRGRGALSAVLSGFVATSAPAVLVFPADDDYNAPRIDAMVEAHRQACDIVVASRFIRGGCMKNCPLLKRTLVRLSALALYYLARLPTRDPTNGLRLFSRRIIERIPVESTVGFAYSIELLVKCHRLGWRIGEVPAEWYQRTHGRSRFRVVRWIPQYLAWFFYAFATTTLGRGPETVKLCETSAAPPEVIEARKEIDAGTGCGRPSPYGRRA